MKVKENQIAQLLRVAKEQITYCKFISNYPAAKGNKNFGVIEPIDIFYKSTCNAFFNDTLLIISSLLDKKDSRVISFWNWNDFVNKKNKELTAITKTFNSSPLIRVRHELVAHQNYKNRNNRIPNSRRRGIIDQRLIDILEQTLEQMISEFRDYASQFSTPYSSQYFDISEAEKEISSVMDQARPTLTDSPVI